MVLLKNVKLDFFRFSSITPDVASLSKIFEAFIIEGSKKGKVAREDLAVYGPTNVNGENITLEQLLNSGTRIFDAVMYLTIPQNERFDPGTGPADFTKFDPDQCARDLFINYFCLLTQATPVVEGMKMANFVTKVLGSNEKPEEIAMRLASFNLDKMSHEWIKEISLNKLGTEAINRLALGVAGYRHVQAIIGEKPNAVWSSASRVTESEWLELNKKAREVRLLLRDWVARGLQWYAHPTTRSPKFITATKSLNKACEDMLTFLFTSKTLNEMKKQKVLYRAPLPNARNRNWVTWDVSTFDHPDDFIFKKVNEQAPPQIKYSEVEMATPMGRKSKSHETMTSDEELPSDEEESESSESESEPEEEQQQTTAPIKIDVSQRKSAQVGQGKQRVSQPQAQGKKVKGQQKKGRK